jgi:hypothetical protein
VREERRSYKAQRLTNSLQTTYLAFTIAQPCKAYVSFVGPLKTLERLQIHPRILVYKRQSNLPAKRSRLS